MVFIGSIEKAWALWQVGNVAGAETELHKILGDEPEDVAALALLSMCREARGDPEEAIRLARQAVAADGSDDFAWRVLGHMLENFDKNLSEAEEAYERSVSLAPGDAYNHLALATFFDRRRNRKKAANAFELALRLDPDNETVLADYAGFLIAGGDRARAGKLLQRALEIAPDNRGLILQLGEVAFREGRMEEARERALWVLSQAAEDRQALVLLTKVKARKNPVMGLWLNWAMFLGRFSGKAQLGLILGLWLLYQISARTFLTGLPMGVQIGIAWGYILFCLMTWIAPYIFARMVRAEMKKVQLSDDF